MTIRQSYPEIGDKVYQSQVLRLLVFGKTSNGDIVEKSFQYKMEAAAMTQVEVDLGEGVEPVACLVNSGNIGYLRNVLDSGMISFFLKHVSSVKTQLDRSQVWLLLSMHVTMGKLKPGDFVSCVCDHLVVEDE